ncbi:MAG: outer membrane protein [Vicinamibacterales bacterium]
MSQRLIVWAFLGTTFLFPFTAHADWFARGLGGGAFGGQVTNSAKSSLGGAFGWLGEGRVGAEIEASHTPDVFQVPEVPEVLLSESSVTTVMFNGIFQVRGGSSAVRLRPYASGGAGWLRARVGNDEDFVRARESHVGINVGGGADASFSERWGVGGDLRYFRDLQDLEGESEFFSLGEQKVDFWRAVATVFVRF